MHLFSRSMKQIAICALGATFALYSCDNKSTTEEKVENTANEVLKVTSEATEQAVEKIDNAEAPTSFGEFQLEETEYNFGTIQQNDEVEHTFKFKNTGDAPLIISNIGTSCGCTTPSYTKDPVAPGEEGEIFVKFNSAGKSGNQNKAITITANTKTAQTVLYLKGMVEVPDNSMGPIAK